MTDAADGVHSMRAALILGGGLEVHPNNAAPAGPVTSPATNWGFGALVELAPAGQFNSPFYIVGITAWDNIAAQTGLHEVRLYYGAADVLFADWKFYLDGPNNIIYDRVFWGMGQFSPAAYGEPIPANSRIRADLAFSAGAGGASSVLFDIYVKRALG